MTEPAPLRTAVSVVALVVGLGVALPALSACGAAPEQIQQTVEQEEQGDSGEEESDAEAEDEHPVERHS